MPRRARDKSKRGIYHIILRGQNRQILFEDDEDREKFIETLRNARTKSGCAIYAYCLMGNHIHLLLHEKEEGIGIIMRRIGASYVYWYNWKYKRCGHLFQDRYKSDAVEDDKYFLTVLRYIHQNPAKAGLVKKAEEFKWSSYGDYMSGKGITDTEFPLSILDTNLGRALDGFREFHEEQNSDICLEADEKFRLRDEDALEIIKSKCCIKSGSQLNDTANRDQLIRELKQEGISTRQLERLSGISRTRILKA